MAARSTALHDASDGGRIRRALCLGFGKILDPGGELAEGRRHTRKRLHGESLFVSAERQKGIDPLMASGVKIGNPEDVGGGVSGQSITKENGTARRCRTRALRGHK